MKKSKILVIGMSLLSMMSGLAACTSSGSNSKEIVFWHCLGHDKTTNLEALVKKFNDAHASTDGYQVKLEATGGSYDTLDDYIKTNLKAGKVPSITMGYPDSFSGYMGTRGASSSTILKLDDFIKNDSKFDMTSFVSAYYDEGTHYQYEGTWSMPMYKSTEAMYYNVKMFHSTKWYETNKDKTEEKNDLNGGKYTVKFGDPSTWDWETLVNACTAIQEENKNTSDFYALGYDSDANLMISQMKQRGIAYTTATGSTADAHFTFYNDTDARTKLKDLVSEIYNLTTNHILSTQETYGNYSSTLFLQKKVMFTIGSTGGSAYNDTNEFTVGLAKVPAYKNNQQYILQGPSICLFDTGDTAKEQATWNFYSQYLSEATLNAELALENSYDPVRTASYTTQSYKNWISLGLDADGKEDQTKELKYRIPSLTSTLKDNYFTSPVFIGSSAARTQMGKILTYVKSNNGNIDSAIKNVYDNAVLASN